MSDSYIDAVPFEYSRETTHVCLAVVIWEYHFGLDDSRSLNQLVWRHRVGLVSRQESNVNVLNG